MSFKFAIILKLVIDMTLLYIGAALILLLDSTLLIAVLCLCWCWAWRYLTRRMKVKFWAHGRPHVYIPAERNDDEAVIIDLVTDEVLSFDAVLDTEGYEYPEDSSFKIVLVIFLVVGSMCLIFFPF